MLQYENAGPKKYNGMFDCFRKIYAEEGVSGWYRVSYFFFHAKNAVIGLSDWPGWNNSRRTPDHNLQSAEGLAL